MIVHLRDGKTLSYLPLRPHRTVRPFDSFFSNLDYNGGPVMGSNTNYTIYWRPAGAPAYPAGYREGVDRYLEDLAHDSGGHQNVDSVSAQYNDAGGEFATYDSHFGGTFTDEDPYPTEHDCERAPICITDEQIQTELKTFVQAHGLPTDLEHEYFLLTPPGVEDCFEEAGEECSAGSEIPVYCAYHNNAPIKAGTEVVGQLIYANDPYVTGIFGCDDGDHPNGSPSDGVIQGGLSHEHDESITDPLPNSGWTDFATGERTGAEVGDKCDTGVGVSEFGPALGEVEVEEKFGVKVKAKYNQEVDGHKYWYQQEWSNQGYKCLQRLTFAGAEPSATFVSEPAGVNTLSLDAGASSALGGVSQYSWQFNDSEIAPDTQETTTPTVTHTFPTAGFHLVALTVYGETGTSLGSADIVRTGFASPSAAFTVSTTAPAATVPTQFDASASGGSIAAYEWNFGDGSGGVGPLPSHTYAQPGVYSVTLFIEDEAGQVVTVAHQVTIGPVPSSGGGGGGGSGGSGATAPANPVPPQPLPPVGVGTVVLLGGPIAFAANGAGVVKLSCVGTATCTGKLTLTIKVKGRAKHARARSVTLASATFSIAPGTTGAVALKLNAAGRSQLRARHGRLGATLTIAKSAPAPAATQTHTVQLKQRAKR